MISPNLAQVFSKAVKYIKDNNENIITVEHIFYYLLFDESIQIIFEELDVDHEKMKIEMFDFLEDNKETYIGEGEPVESLIVSNVLETSVRQVINSGRNEIEVWDFLIQLLNLNESYCSFLMKQGGITELELLQVISEDTHKNYEDKNLDGENGAIKKKEKKKILINLTEELIDSKDKIIGRDKELNRIVQILSRKKKSNPILVGEAGVGKTALVEGLVYKISENEVPKNLEGSTILSLNMGTMTAGTKYRGDFEKKFQLVLDELKEFTNPILFIDEIHTVMGSGTKSLDVGDLLKPYLSNGSIKCIGTTTYSEYKATFQKNDALNRRFSKVDIKEPSISDSIEILEGIKDNYEEFHNVSYSKDVIIKIVEMSQKHLHDKFLPDSAIDLMDEIGSKKQISNKTKNKTKININDVHDTISELANIPSKNINSNSKKLLLGLTNSLKKHIFGQDEIIDKLTDTIYVNKAGLSNPNKPIASFLFTGPTGVGKTEMAKTLAISLGISFNRLDMSEYMEKHSVSKLIGAAPGYVGYEEGGVLVELIKKNPHSIILFDEIEKAHPDISNILLQILDEGVLTDNTGYKADFKNAIIILTSNLGTKKANTISFQSDEKEISNKTKSAINDYFSPEIRNRLDNIVEFNSLDKVSIIKIVEKNINFLKNQLESKKILIKFTKESKEKIANEGYDQLLGARPIERAFEKMVKQEITKEILFGEVEKGGEISVSVKDDKLFFKYKKTLEK